ncbi:SMP-30/gluconolactonase/LRE family protein [Sphingomonas sp. KC8]|uniref:SMP-30/gluconolactonase/LRE family protein n=1 Tax=Sphingomonas sp. KC8 TaxID=1030157 RepID=UPI000248B53C|nr:SMP-30/gluconolactonase/LRE family protein [Sphingomonas sp. KC8]ARS26041.1 5-valerolactone hydrolase [Sphingomonas sp. KC8]
MKDHVATQLADGFVFLEGPRWRDDALWVSDMWGHEVLRVTMDGVRETVCTVPERPSGLGFLPDGTLLVVSMVGRRVMRVENGELVLHADLSGLAGGDCNDMIVDETGAAYVGNFGYDLFGGATPAKADLIAIDRAGVARTVASALEFPNGMVLVEEGRTLVVAESWARRLLAFDRHTDGSLSHRRVYADLGGRSPDGIAVDAEDGIWVACYDTDEFVRVREGGVITDRIPIPGRHAIACALGGPDGRTLFCCTFSGDYTQMGTGARNSAIEIARVDVPAPGF